MGERELGPQVLLVSTEDLLAALVCSLVETAVNCGLPKSALIEAINKLYAHQLGENQTRQ